jgi:ribonuclease P/MRP protein subunit RPP1
MGISFIDLHVHSRESGGRDSRAELEKHASDLGVEIHFCDGTIPEDGVEIAFKTRSELKRKPSNAAYLIIDPLSKEILQAAARINRAIIRTTLTPTLSKIMHNNNAAVEICLSTLVKSSGIGRVRTIKSIKTNLKYARKYGVAIVATTGSKSIYDLRSPYQVFETLKVLDFTDTEAKDAMCTAPTELLNFGTAVMEKRLVQEGVKIL